MEDLIQHHSDWKYVINLPSQQFPLKTNEDLVHILTILNGSNEIKGSASMAMPQRYPYNQTLN